MINFICLLLGCFWSIFTYYEAIAYNPYIKQLYMGQTGSGKTTHMCKSIQEDLKKGWTCYCNVPIPGAYLISPKMLGKTIFPPESSIYIDEAALVWHNRNWKNLDMSVIEYMRLVRHYKNKLTLYTQSLHDIDVSFMRVCDRLHLLSNYKQVIGKIRHLRFKQVLIPASDTAEARITDDIIAPNIFLGGMSFYWMPKWWDYFDTYDKQMELKEQVYEYIDYPPHLKKKPKSLKGHAGETFLKCPQSDAPQGPPEEKAKDDE